MLDHAGIVEKHVRMANQIAGFFRSYPHDQAVAGIHDHLKKFWTRRMLGMVHDHREAGGAGIDPLVAEALIWTPPVQSPIHKETGGPREVGQMASDAG